MHHLRHPIFSVGFLLVASLFFALTPFASTAFAATTGTHAAVKVTSVAASNPINNCPPGQGLNDDNDWVMIIQFRLNVLDAAGLKIDGFYGPDTDQAVSNFQHIMGITDGGGGVGNRTWSALGFCLGFSPITLGYSATTSHTNCPPSQGVGSFNTFVNAIQDLLNVDFYASIFSDSPSTFTPFLASDGNYQTQTQSAVTDFQTAVGISGGGGAVGQRTWSELGMCF